MTSGGTGEEGVDQVTSGGGSGSGDLRRYKEGGEWIW